MERVINFHDGEDDNVYVDTDVMLTYFMPTEIWNIVDVPNDIKDNNIAKATYLLYYTDHFKSTVE